MLAHALMRARAAGHARLRYAARAVCRRAACLTVGALLGGLSTGPTAAAAEVSATAPEQSTTLVIAGSGTMSPLVRAIADRFCEHRPGVSIDVRAQGSDRGLQALRAGKIDIAMFSRPLDDDMTDLVGVPIARDGVSLVVHGSNPVRSLDSAQVTAIYSLQVRNWRDLGGDNLPIRVLVPEPGRSSAEIFARHFGVDLTKVPAADIVTSNSQRLQRVASDRNAIVFMSIGEAERAVQAGQPVHLIAVDGIAATSRNVRKGDFPLARPLVLVTRGLPKGLAREFIEFAMSSSVTGLIRQLDFVPYVD